MPPRQKTYYDIQGLRLQVGQTVLYDLSKYVPTSPDYVKEATKKRMIGQIIEISPTTQPTARDIDYPIKVNWISCASGYSFHDPNPGFYTNQCLRIINIITRPKDLEQKHAVFQNRSIDNSQPISGQEGE